MWTARPSGRRLQMNLDQIEMTLVAEDPRLWSVFETFTRLMCHEAMPGTEQVPPRRRQARRLLFTAGLIMCLSATVSLSLAFGPHGCGTASGQRQSASQTASCRPASIRH
jgi:ferric-dicitrate binding protein FerR (iron transport regulator)